MYLIDAAKMEIRSLQLMPNFYHNYTLRNDLHDKPKYVGMIMQVEYLTILTKEVTIEQIKLTRETTINIREA